MTDTVYCSLPTLDCLLSNGYEVSVQCMPRPHCSACQSGTALSVPVLLETYTVPVLLETYTVPVLLETYTVPVLLETYTVPVLLETYTVPVLLETYTVPVLLETYTVLVRCDHSSLCSSPHTALVFH